MTDLPSCTFADVRLVINTGLTDENITALIALADAEMTGRSFTSAKWTTDLQKKLAILLTAELVSQNDVMSRGINEYQAIKPEKSSNWRNLAERLIASMQSCYTKATSYSEISET